MRNTLSYISLFIFLVITSCGTLKKSSAMQDTLPKENALLWKIEGKELNQASYLYGTIHIIPSDDFFYPDGTLQAIESCKKMVFEIDIAEMTDISAQMKLMAQAVMKDGTALKDLITAEEYAIVKAHFDKMGLPLAMFERLKPAFLTIFASPEMAPDALQSGDMKSYEMELNDIAQSRNMTTGGLESIEFQIGIFDSIPYDVQAKELVEAIKNTTGGSDELAEMISIYKKQDLQAMQSLFTNEEVMGDNDLLLDNRNRNWIPIIEKTSAEQATFYAVGAGHLVGDQGVISLLRKAGYTVTAVLP